MRMSQQGRLNQTENTSPHALTLKREVGAAGVDTFECIVESDYFGFGLAFGGRRALRKTGRGMCLELKRRSAIVLYNCSSLGGRRR
jgi:hypothetical protein